MNRRGQLTFVFVLVFLLLAITLFALIDPFKTQLDSNRGSSTLNCPGTSDFNQTAYDDQNTLARLTYRTTCFATGMSMVWFVGAILLSGVTWVYYKWRFFTR